MGTAETKKEELTKGFHHIDLNGMSAIQLTHFLTPFLELAGFKWVIIDEDGEKTLKIYQDEKQRTLTQNSALHKYFELVATKLNDAGLDIPTLLAQYPIIDIPWSKKTVKEILWRKSQIEELGKVSTTKLSTKDVDKVYDTLNRYLAQAGIHEPWPSLEELSKKEIYGERKFT